MWMKGKPGTSPFLLIFQWTSHIFLKKIKILVFLFHWRGWIVTVWTLATYGRGCVSVVKL